MQPKIFFTNLDALRFFAFFLVFLSHAPLKNHNNYIDEILYNCGLYGVNLFFVISGFLITYLLFIEKSKFNQVNISSFFIRRLLRIWPLYFLIIIFELIYFLLTRGWEIPNGFYYYLTFLGNFDRIYNEYATVNQFIDFGVLWSIGIEEQFYIVIPLIFYFFNKIKMIPYSLITIHFCVLFYKIYILKFDADVDLAYRMLHFHPFCAFDMISLGCILASFSFIENRLFKTTINKLKIIPYFIFFIVVFFFMTIGFFVKSTFLNELVFKELLSIWFCLLVLKVCFVPSTPNQSNKLFNLVVLQLNNLGKISYGLYIYHCIILSIVTYYFSNGFLISIIAFGLNILISKISYSYFENPILKLKKKFVRIETR